jgi:hypothetical protein
MQLHSLVYKIRKSALDRKPDRCSRSPAGAMPLLAHDAKALLTASASPVKKRLMGAYCIRIARLRPDRPPTWSMPVADVTVVRRSAAAAGEPAQSCSA